jgi:NADH-ubiquinone oxidoreductase chain 5
MFVFPQALGLIGLVRLYMGVLLRLLGGVSILIGLLYVVVDKQIFVEIFLYSFTGGVDLSVVFLIDYVSLMFIGVVLMISSIVLIYRSDYMSSDINFYRFILLVCLFVMSMILMVISPNIVRILLG